MKVRALFALFLLISTPVLAQTVHVIQSVDDRQLIQVDPEDQAENVFFAVRKEEQSRLKIVILKDQNAFSIVLKDSEKMAEGSLFNSGPTLYGGDFHIGSRFRINGTVAYDRKTQLVDIDHNHEYALYQFNLKNYSIEPTFVQNIHFFSIGLSPQSQVMNTVIQPASFGVFIRKPEASGRDFKIGASYGPGFSTDQNPFLANYSLIARVNLRLSIIF